MRPEPVEGHPRRDMRWGPLEPADRAAVEALLCDAEIHDHTGPRILHGWRHQLAPITDELAYTLAARTDDGRLVALGWLSTRPHDEPPRRVFLAGAVHPDFRRGGLGRHVLMWQVETARRWQRETGGDPITIVASSAPLPGVRRLLTHGGFALTRVFAELSRPLPRQRAERALSLSKGLETSSFSIAPFTAERAEEVRLVLNASFADHWGTRPLAPGPWQAVLANPMFRPDWSRLALDAESHIIGFVLNSAVPSPDQDLVGWTDQLGVLAEYRGRGVGSALMEASLEIFEQEELRLAGLGLDTDNPFGAPALYAKLGYRAGFEVHLFTRTEPAVSRTP